MIRWFIVFAGCFFFLVNTGCNYSKSDDKQLRVVRDTTITPANAYSEIFLDSMLLEDFIAKEVNTDSIAHYMRNFYNSRNYSFAWFDDNGLTVQAEGFWNAHDRVVLQASDSSIYDKQLHEIVDTLLSDDSSFTIDKNLIDLTELRFTRHVFQYIQYAYSGRVDPKEVQWHIPRRKLKPIALLDSFLNSKSGDWMPLNEPYRLLQKQLFKYRDIEKNGGWKNISIKKQKFKQGSKDSIILFVKRRLNLAGIYLTGDTTIFYNPELVTAVKQAEASYGLQQDGIINEALIKQLNIPVEERMKQMLVNLERMKWMPEVPANFLLANIPEYRLQVVENGKEVLAMNIVVGKAANRTVIFSDQLKYVVFSPYWNIPRSIVRNEIYPAMKRSSSYLRRNNMEVTGYSNGLPIVRQKPGNSNALGHVKFIFPNSYNIYFHDTPSRSLFSRQERAFSHGCIRLQQPFDLAVYLLRNQPEWTNEKIKAAMNSSKEKWVTLGKTVAVFITYFTSWVDEDGVLHFTDDIYGHDKKLAAHLFE
ncbi:MAG: L,D-transpeptidase family protein [Segetibacter sp.]